MNKYPPFYAKKRFGQNFLVDESIIHQIVRVICPQATDHIVEIGPGLMALTRPIVSLVHKLDVIEIDRDFIQGLLQLAQEFPALIVHQADALEFDFKQLTLADEKLRLIGNLPYNISTPLLFHVLENSAVIQDMHFMLQHEVAERICAKPNNKDYGRLSVMLQYYCATDYLFTVPPEAFEPAPKVFSAIIRLTPHIIKPVVATDEDFLAQLVLESFAMRRKTLRNNLKARMTIADWQTVDIDSSRRPETLSVEEFVRIANFCCESQDLSRYTESIKKR